MNNHNWLLERALAVRDEEAMQDPDVWFTYDPDPLPQITIDYHRRTETTCIQCGRTFLKRSDRKHRVFCSQACSNRHRHALARQRTCNNDKAA